MGADKFIDILRPHKIAYLPHIKEMSTHLKEHACESEWK